MKPLYLASWVERLLVALAFGWTLAACGGGGAAAINAEPGARPYRIAVDFSPYEGAQDPNTGASVDDAQIARRLDPLIGYVKAIRTFGATYGLERIPALAQARRLQVWAGAWIRGDRAANEREIAALIEIGRARQAAVLIVGSEVLLRGDLPESELLAHMARVRAAVPADIPVTTADTYGVLLSRPAVMSASDIVFANFHPYWEGLSVEQAMSVIHLRWSQLQAAAGRKRAAISEVGWPSGGAAFGAAVPSPASAARFFLVFTTWARANGVEFFYFAVADEAWKAKTAEGEVGRHWGLWFADGTTLKPGMQAVFDSAGSRETSTVPDVPGGPGTPSIAFTFVAALGSLQDLTGRVLHVRPTDHVVAVYIRVNGAWWMKPTLAQPKTPIRPDGSWICDITTGGIDERATAIAAFVIPATSEVPVALGASSLPPALGGMAVASVQVARP